MVRFEKEVLPRLSGVRNLSETAATGGSLEVTVKLPTGVSADDLLISLSPAATATLHVAVQHRPVQAGGRGCQSLLVDLRPHLPAGAGIAAGRAGGNLRRSVAG